MERFPTVDHVTSPFTPPWSLILPELERRSKVEAAGRLLKVWQECVHGDDDEICAPLARWNEQGFSQARYHGRIAADQMRELVGPESAASMVQEAYDLLQDPLRAPRHDIWRLYMFVKGVAANGFVELPMTKPSEVWRKRVGSSANSDTVWSTWAIECLIESGRTGGDAPPADDSPIWRTWCM